jgi:hypothetical protein
VTADGADLRFQSSGCPVRVADCRKLPARILGSNAPGEQISALTCTVTSEHALEETYSRRDAPLTHLNQRPAGGYYHGKSLAGLLQNTVDREHMTTEYDYRTKSGWWS